MPRLLQGSTNAKELSSKGVKIWDANGSRDFLDSLGFSNRAEGDLGPVYGFQWRHFGAEYKDMDSDYSGQGVDQLQKVIDTIKTNPNDRRIILCAWNPKGDFVHTLGDAHVYLNHIEPLKTQREPRPFPKLKILRKVEKIDDFKAEDFQIEGYNPHPTIKMEMAV
ncbi:TYMS [Cervus elaphus hippelaphus]|uniref:Thymidylate synthase n=1 Tax=Cervus elaphus hippelaphus TaxID=46360 RepID=A0A212C6U1_CEREH|nr:TYMS [Cervus elaphus hippelaphus]